METFVSDCVSQTPLYGRILFDIAVRCTPINGSRRRQPQETAWLQEVFSTLRTAIISTPSEMEVLAITHMLETAILYRVELELQLLRLIASQHGLRDGSPSWTLLAVILRLDSNVFLIPSAPEDLMKELLSNVTRASTQQKWPSIADIVIDEILLPLMDEFTKARKLTSFIYHWYEQLAEFENIRKTVPRDMNHFSAWEDGALGIKLEGILERSLTTQQIVELLDWLQVKARDCRGAGLVVAESIAGSIRREETIAAIATRSYLSMDPRDYTDVEERYRSRMWRYSSYIAFWIHAQDLPGGSFISKYFDDLLNYTSEQCEKTLLGNSLETLEFFRFCCSVSHLRQSPWNAYSILSQLSKKISIVLEHIKNPENGSDGGFASMDDIAGGRFINTKRSGAWFAFAYARCVLVEFPRVLG